MSRELKFRAWHKEGYFDYLDLREGGECDFTNLQLANAPFEQYTGLKDKNGKEIYDGDIVKIARSYGYGFLPKGAKAKIEFDEKELCYKLRGNGEFRLTSKKEVEVIGNIHENPELLEKAK